MTKRHEISDEVRDDAAVLCAAMAAWWELPLSTIRPPRTDWHGTDVLGVAIEAFSAVIRVVQVDYATVYREAEALLRDGWCPGDKIRRVKRRKVSP